MNSMRLTREVRFSLTQTGGETKPLNSWAGWPGGDCVAPYIVLRATVCGPVDAQTGYLCNIVAIDRAVRDAVIPMMCERYRSAASGELAGAALVRVVVAPLASRMPEHVELVQLEMRVTPFLAYTWRGEQSEMVSVTQSFEFAAAHRLYCENLSDAENREIFGKCANPNGHGHNYVVEVTVSGTPEAQSGQIIELWRLERTVKERVIDVLDHKHLNLDCPEFADTNPSVENITRVIWDKLVGALEPAALSKVRVYETPKTYAEFCG